MKREGTVVSKSSQMLRQKTMIPLKSDNDSLLDEDEELKDSVDFDLPSRTTSTGVGRSTF